MKAVFYSGKLLAHCVCGIFACIAIFFTVWALIGHQPLPPAAWMTAMKGLFEPWVLGSGFDIKGLLWGFGAILIFILIGWYYLCALEIYIPLSAIITLAFLFGMGLCGFIFECLAIPFLLNRRCIGISLLGLLFILTLRAYYTQKRRLKRLSDSREIRMQQIIARETFASSLVRPICWIDRIWRWIAVGLIGLITCFDLWHALLYPEVYWDSLILYLGYARMTFLEGGFPIKVTGQVGIGLGANYPHLFSVLGSAIAASSGEWSELPQRLIAPLCGIGATLLVYHTALLTTRRICFSICLTLLYRSIPLGIIYDQYASDYALAIFFAAAFLYLAALYLETGLKGIFEASTLLIALSMHLNYLMGILWLPWVFMVFLAHTGLPIREGWSGFHQAIIKEAPWMICHNRTPLLRFLKSWRFWRVVLCCLCIGSTWYVRNWIVTGNPVYAFFYETLGGRNINPEVIKAAEIEWQANGGGIGQLTDQRLQTARQTAPLKNPMFRTSPFGAQDNTEQLNRNRHALSERMRMLDQLSPFGLELGRSPLGGTVWERILTGWAYFIGPLGDGRHWNLAWRTLPIFPGFTLMGMLLWIGLLFNKICCRRREVYDLTVRFGWIVACLMVVLLGFHFVLAPFYLYQIVMITPCFALMLVPCWQYWQLKPWRWIFGGLALMIGLMPGVAMSMMGFKVTGPFNISESRREIPQSLYPLRHPLVPINRFYAWRYGEDVQMWEYINQHLRGEKLLTHENRHLVYDSSITLIHLDDWDIQQLWNLASPVERVHRLVNIHQIRYYLYVPNEDSSPTNAYMGAKHWPTLGLAELVFEAGANKLYRLTPP